MVVEARRNNTIKPSGTDYSSEIEDEEEEETPEETEEETDTEDEELQSTDYTEETEDNEEEPDMVDEENEEELEPTDYTEEDSDDESETDEGESNDETGDESTEDDELEPSDYTEEDPDDTEDESSDEDEETPEEGSDETDSTDGSEEESEDEDKKKNAELFADCTLLYEAIKNISNKLATYDKTTIFVNKILIQINKNLNETRKSLWNFIIYEFDKGNYVTNLTRYNYFVENIRINITMLKKTMDYVSKSETFK